MDEHLALRCGDVLESRGISVLEEIAMDIHLFMCHIDQEPEVFDTGNKASQKYKEVKRWISDYSVNDYLNAALNGERLPCTCKEMAEVGGHLTAILLDKDISVIGKVRPLYMKGNVGKHKHYMDCYFNGGNPIFFDFSVYRMLWDENAKDWVSKDKEDWGMSGFLGMPDFNPVNIDFTKFIEWQDETIGWLQKGNRPRVMQFANGNVVDSYAQNGEKYMKVISPSFEQ